VELARAKALRRRLYDVENDTSVLPRRAERSGRAVHEKDAAVDSHQAQEGSHHVSTPARKIVVVLRGGPIGRSVAVYLDALCRSGGIDHTRQMFHLSINQLY
jgi:hypothetical protein